METPVEYSTPQTPKPLILAILGDRPIAYHPVLAKALGGVKQAIFVSQLLYWTDKGVRPDGFIWKTQEEWYDETGLSPAEQRTARKHLVKAGILQEKLMSIPARLYYRLDTDTLLTRLQEYHQQDVKDLHNKDCTTSPAIPEITSETTPETTEQEGATAPPAPADVDLARPPRTGALPDDDRLFYGEDEPTDNPAQEYLKQARDRIGADLFSVTAHCQERQEVEGQWTVPEHRGLSPQCAVYKEATGYSPVKAVRADIDAAIPDNPEALENWYKVAHGWVLTGYSYKNVAGMLDWYAEGRVGRDKPLEKRNGGSSTSRAADVHIAHDTVTFGVTS